jgi:CRP/FNR family transcriptional regulator, anaerobic regulatory protein
VTRSRRRTVSPPAVLSPEAVSWRVVVFAIVPHRASASFARLRSYLTARAALTPAEIEFVRGLFTPRHLERGEVLQRAGERARLMVFVAKGCLRSYVIDEKGKVHIVGFAAEDWWLSDSAPYLERGPATLFIDAIEASDVLLTDHASHERMLDAIPALAAAYRTGLQRLAAARDKRIISSLTASARDRYVEFVDRYPTLVRRVPLRMLASYLGMTPETLSRVRKNLSTRRRGAIS